MKQHNSTRPMLVRRAKVSLFACAVVAFGLLLWARFIIVTGHPRTAIADPATQHDSTAVAEKPE